MEIKNKNKEKSTRNDPTPYLGKPNSRNQMFTYSENKLLDQITLEVMEAWKDDLISIRKTHEEAKKYHKFLKYFDDEFKGKLSKLDDILAQEGDIYRLDKVLQNQHQIYEFINEIRINILNLENKINYPLVKDASVNIAYLIEISKEIKQIQEDIQKVQVDFHKKKWWQIWK